MQDTSDRVIIKMPSLRQLTASTLALLAASAATSQLPPATATPPADDRGGGGRRLVAAWCLHNLTQPDYVLDAPACPWSPFAPGCLPGGSSESSTAQGAGWVEGDFTSLAYVNQEQAVFELQLNSTGLPSLTVAVAFVGVGLPRQLRNLTMHIANGSREPTRARIDVQGLPDGEFVALVAPDAASRTRGWCGSFVRWLRVHTEPTSSIPATSMPLLLPPGKPTLLFDDFWLQSRRGTSRRVIPAKQLRVTNQTWPRQYVTPSGTQRLGAGAWMVPIENPLGTGTVTLRSSPDNKSISFEAALNHEFRTSPDADPNATRLICSGEITMPFTSDAEIDQFVCRAKTTADYNSSMDTLPSVVAAATTAAPDGAQKPWPPPQLPPRWSWPETHVRWYDPASDGPVDVHALGVFFNDLGSPHWSPLVFGNGSARVTLGLAAAYPYWQRLSPTGGKETVILTVGGERKPLLHGPEFGDAHTGPSWRFNATIRRGPCHRLDYGRPTGPMHPDPVCMGDNFGGELRTPARTDVHGNVTPESYIYSMGREVPGFSPRVAPYDNLPTAIRTQASWVTTDGLNWRQRWWGEMPLENAQSHMRIPQNYGVDNFCAGEESSFNSCLDTTPDMDSGATVLAMMRPYDAGTQQFGMDVMTSRGGSYFKTTKEDVPAPKQTTFLPPGQMGQWNGGLLSTMMGGGRQIGRYYYTIVHMATNLPHFATSLLDTSNCSASELAAGSARQYWAPLVSLWGGWAQLGGWEGLAKLCREATRAPMVIRYRYQGWVALVASTVDATVVTRPILAPNRTGCGYTAIINADGRPAQDAKGCIRVSLEHGATGGLLPEWSGTDAAQLCGDEIDAPLVFAGKTLLPPEVCNDGIVFCVEMEAGMQLFNLQLGCPVGQYVERGVCLLHKASSN